MNFNDFSFFSFCWSTWLFVHLELFQLALIMLAAWRLFQKKGKTVTFFFCFCFLLLLPKMPKYHIRTSYAWLEGPSLMLQVLFDTATNISLNADIFQELNWLSKKKEESTVCASTCAIWYCCRLACLKRKTPQRKSAAVLLEIIACPEGKKSFLFFAWCSHKSHTV